MDERPEKLDSEWRHKYEELDNMRQRQLHEMGNTMHTLVAVLCDAIKIGVHDVDTVNKTGHVVQTGLARLRAIDRAADAARDPEAPQN
jgi:hypothetical protein